MLLKSEKKISCWNNYPIANCYLLRPEHYDELKRLDSSSLIARGLGRSYGDASLNTKNDVLLMERLNRFLAFDPITGILRAEAGTSLKDILDVFVPLGWFPNVTPGTKFVTLGGCVAADVHGKNHHIDGAFSNHVKSLELILADGTARQCSPENNPDLFWATVGGMGLTGIISEVTLQLRPIETAYMIVKHTAAQNLNEALALLERNDPQNPYSVAWIDCLATGDHLGRSIVMEAHHAAKDEISISDPFKPPATYPLSLPLNLPSWLLNRYTVQAFNTLYYKMQRRATKPFSTHFNPFFYPLDSLLHWNRLYGRQGFIQYQFVVPTHTARMAMSELLAEISNSKRSSFLAVLKRFGPANPAFLSFPFEGYTLAIDIPIKDQALFSLLDRLDQLVLKHAGRLYLAKDARMQPDVFRSMYPRLAEWQRIKTLIDPTNIYSSDLSRRLKMEVPHER